MKEECFTGDSGTERPAKRRMTLDIGKSHGLEVEKQ